VRKQSISILVTIGLLVFASITSTIQQQVYSGKDDDDDDDDEDNKEEKKKSIKQKMKESKYRTWEGKLLNYDEMVERNQKCIEMERKGFLPSSVNCVSFPLTQIGESMIIDYIVQMAMKGYYEPN
jgi:hypothetical protein